MKICLSISFVALAYLASAQNEADVQRYTSKYFQGTARSIGLGGAMGALGGDMSSIHLNPASIGVYRFGTISLTPAVEINEISTNLNGTTSAQLQNKLVINNVGFILAYDTKNPLWKTVNFGASFNRINSFNDVLSYDVANTLNQSLLQDFLNEANGSFAEDLNLYSARLPFETFVIDSISGAPTSYLGRIGVGDIRQVQTAKRNGNMAETAINLGANYNDVLYIGATIGFQSVKYNSEVITEELPLNTTATDLINYELKEILEIEGLGVNFKIGAIAKAGDHIRLGASIHTPTTINLTDNYRNSMVAQFEETQQFPAETTDFESPVGVFDYRIKTPWRYMVSIAGIIGKKGLLSAQYEYTDFGSGELKNRSGDNSDFAGINSLISNAFSNSNSYRFGGEFRLTEQYYLRAGYAMFTNPNKSNNLFGVNLDRVQYSAGFGYRAAKWNLDMAYQLVQFKELYQPTFSGNVATLTNSLQTVAVTVGFRL